MPTRRFTEPNSWLKHISTKLDSAVPYAARGMMMQKGRELYAETIRQMAGGAGQQQGTKRPGWLARNDHPFARRHGFPLMPAAPVGIVSSELLASIRFDLDRGPGLFSVGSSSVGVEYAKFILSADGTSQMLPRQVKQRMYLFSLQKSDEFAQSFVLWLRRY